MSQNPKANRERLLQLMTDHATEGLEAPEQRILSELLIEHPDVDALELELAAAAIDLAMMNESPAPLPTGLRDRLLTDAGRHFAATATQSSVPEAAVSTTRLNSDATNRKRYGRFGYFLAAASLMIAVAGWWQVARLTRSTSQSPAQPYASFLRETADVVRIPWAGQQAEFLGVTGEAVWSQSKQKGFLRFVGLAPNDPAKAQYQLWIVDPSRDKHPIDGGVFNVGSSGEVIVPIDPKLTVNDPKAFAITLEKPGGVVVSDGPLLVVGAVPG